MAAATTAHTDSAVASRHPDSAAKNLMSLSAIFLVIGALDISLMLLKLAIPGVFDATALLSYGHLRPAAFTMVVLGFGGTLTQAIAYYLTPRLVGAPLRNERIAAVNGYAYTGLVLAGSLWVLVFGPDGGEFAEFPFGLDIAVAMSMLVAAGIVTATIKDRTEPGLFVSLLFVMGSIWWYPGLYITGMLDLGGGVGFMMQMTVTSAAMMTMAFPAAALGASFYVVAKEADVPLYSGGLAKAAFWTLAGTGLVAAPARIMAGPAPAWLETIASIMSLGLALTGLCVLTTLMLTVSGDWDAISANPALKLIIAGAAAYAAVSLLMGIQGFRGVAAVVSLTTWNEGLSLGLMLVAVPLLGMGFVFHAFPRAAGREIFGPGTASRGLRYTLWAGGLTSLLLVIAGIISGLSWNAGASSGAFANSGTGFQQSLGAVSAMYTVAAVTSIVAVIGLALLSWTFIRTFTSGTVAATELLMVDGGDDG